MRVFLALALAGLLAATRASDPVSMNVFVQNGDVPAIGLTKTDFVLTDNGAEQVIDRVMVDARPVDVTLLLDVTGDAPPTLDQVTRTVTSLTRVLAAEDRMRVITFGGEVTLTVPLQSATQPVSVSLIARNGRPVLNAALLYALTRPGEPGRRHLIVAITAGRDMDLLLGTDQLSAVANRSDAVLVALLTKATFSSLGEVVRATGGAIYGLSGDLPSAFNGVLENFKGAYRVQWTPQPATPDGWHAVKVAVPGFKKYTVRARPGYVSSVAAVKKP